MISHSYCSSLQVQTLIIGVVVVYQIYIYIYIYICHVTKLVMKMQHNVWQRKQERETHDKLNVSVFVDTTARYMNTQSRYHILLPPDN